MIALAVGAAVAGVSSLGVGRTAPTATRAECFASLRLLRHAIATYTAQYGHLPGSTPPGEPPDDARASTLLVRELVQPRDAEGMPSQGGPFPGLIDAIPANPFTRSRDVVVVPDGVDPAVFAAASHAGWAYLTRAGRDAAGPLPAGLLLPCGSAGTGGSVQDLAFEVEDFARWR